MTILWDFDPEAHHTYRYALGESPEVMSHGPSILKAAENGVGHRMVVIGADIDIESACQLAERLRVERPEVGVLLLRHRLDVNVMSLALRSGIREVVQVDDQTALAEAARRSEALTAQLVREGDEGEGSGGSRQGKVITVFSAKGGVGKTTVSTNVAAHLAASGARTLLVDLDLMFGDVAISLQLIPSGTVSDLVSMRGHLDRAGLESVVATHEDTGLDVIAPSSDPGEAERVPADVILELLRTARSHYAYVVVDTPPSFTEHVLTALDVSDLTLLVATLDIPAVKNLRLAINTLDTLGASAESRVVVLNRAGVKVGLDSDEVETALKQPISASIPNDLGVPKATNRGYPIVVQDPRNPAAVAIRELADREVRTRFGELIQESPRRGLGRRRSKV
ncbi:AAA family ATPase [Janibacter cremeus]|uniref:AAA family ATPase n=1 Tax=Janibacter cremeus TaxID=1285192 RepID=UPI0023F8BBEB|nr:AAA family ATPase [Janibacter cremeus]WEV76992.1 AAA family ATPase [Janibacter cremeus]